MNRSYAQCVGVMICLYATMVTQDHCRQPLHSPCRKWIWLQEFSCKWLQVFMSAEADRALGKAQGGNNSQGPIYKVPVSNLTMTVCCFAWPTGYEIHTIWCLKPCGCLIPLEHLHTTCAIPLHTLTYLPALCVVPLQA